MKNFILAVAILLCAGAAHAQLYSGVIDPARVSPTWSSAGVIGGIPSGTWVQCGSTISAYSGTTDTINNAIAACPANTYVLLGPGTFTLNSSGSVSQGIQIHRPNVVLRGSGANQTIIVMGAGAKDGCGGFSAAICIQDTTTPSGSGYPGVGTTVSWTAGYAQGTTVIALSTVSGIKAGVS